jgi:hypothetical protein
MKKLLALLLLALTFALPCTAQTRDHANRLGRTMAYTSADGVSHSQSFWCLNFAAFSIGDSTARLEFVGYHSVQAYDSGAEPISGAVRSYQITPEHWQQSVFVPLPAPSQPFAVNFLMQSWAVALQTQDVCTPRDEGEPVCVSFFAQSTAAQ